MATENITPAFQAKENYYVRKGLTPLPEPTITGMKLLGDVSIGDLILNTRTSDGTVWVCTEIEGWWTLPEPDYPSVEKSFGDGSYDVSGRYQRREITLEGSILVPSPAMAPAARKTLVEAINLVYGGAWLKTVEDQGSTVTTTNAVLTDDVATITTASEHTFNVGDVVVVAGTATTGSPLVFYGTHIITSKTSNTFSFAKENENITSISLAGTATVGAIIKSSWVRLADAPKITSETARGRIDFSVDLVAPDPIKYFWASANNGYEVVTLNPKNSDTSVTGDYTVINKGDASVGIELTINGPVIAPLTIKNSTTNQTLTISSPVSGSGTIDISKKAYFDGMATLTTSGPHGLYLGKQVVVAGVDNNFNGTHIVEDIPADNKFSYQITYNAPASFTAFSIGKSYSISSRSVTSNVASITTDQAHGFVAGMQVRLLGFTSAGEVLNGIHQIKTVPTSTTFTFDIVTPNISAVNPSGAIVFGNIVTLSSSGVLPYSVGDLLTVENMNPAVNVSNVSVLSVAQDGKSLTYYSERSRAVKEISYENTPDDTVFDEVTLYTWTRHGVRVGDTIFVQGCGRPVNGTSASSITEAVATSVDGFSITYKRPTLTRKLSEISISKADNGNYRVTVKTVDDIGFYTGDVVTIRGVLPGGTQPPGINGSFAITRVAVKQFYYDVKPKSSTPNGLVEFFGANSGKVPLSSVRNNFAALANIQRKPINTGNTDNVGGRLTCFALIPTTVKTGSGISDFIEEQPATGTLATTADVLILNTKDRSAYLNDDPAYARGKLSATTDWVKLAPGSNTISVVDSGDETSTATISMKYRSGWLS